LDGGLCCRICGAHARTKASINNFIYAPCLGSVVQRIAQLQPVASSVATPIVAPLGAAHRLVTTGSVSWCSVCGAYSEKRIRNLAGVCKGKPKLTTSTGRGKNKHIKALERGLHPLTGVRL
jgi:hypothetical protein